MDRAIIDAIASHGFEVWMRNPSDTWLYYTDGTRIGYLQDSRQGGLTISTVHIPNRTTGTGFALKDKWQYTPITKERLEHGFAFAPVWASNRDRESIKKWKDWAAFMAASRFNGEYKRVDVGAAS